MKNNLKEFRKQKGLTQFQLAVKVGVGIDTINKIENGYQIPSLDTTQRIASALGVTVDELFPTEAKVAQ